MQDLVAPVYLMVAEKDIFFPYQEVIKKCDKIFKNVRGSYILKNAKHAPHKGFFLKS